MNVLYAQLHQASWLYFVINLTYSTKKMLVIANTKHLIDIILLDFIEPRTNFSGLDGP